MNEEVVFSFDQIVEAVRNIADNQVDDYGFHAAIDVGCELLGISSDKMIDLLYKPDNGIK